MKENLEFKNLGDMYENLPNNKRPKDILVEGKSIFETPKSPAQMEVINTATRIIKEHLDKLGINQIPFDEKRIAFLRQQYFMHSGQYHDADFFSVDESSEANLGTIVHELIHAQSAEWRNYDESKVEEFLNKTPGGVKSGFQRNWHHKLGSINFHNLNEGITREMMANNPDELKRLKPMFEGRMEEVIAKREKYFQEEILPAKRKEIEADIKKYTEHIEKIKNESEQRIVEIDRDLERATSEREREGLQKLRTMEKEFTESNIQTWLKEIEDKKVKTIAWAEEINALKIQGIKDDYSFSNERMSSYDFNVEIVDELVEGLAKISIKKNPSLNIEEEKKKIWVDLQKAYLLGQTVYLRKVEEDFGEGFLRKIESINVFSPDDEQKEFLKEIRESLKIK